MTTRQNLCTSFALSLITISVANAAHFSIEADGLTGKTVAGATVVVKCQRSAPNLPIVRAGLTNAQGIFDAGILPDGEKCSLDIISLNSKEALIGGVVSIPNQDAVAIEPLFDTIE